MTSPMATFSFPQPDPYGGKRDFVRVWLELGPQGLHELLQRVQIRWQTVGRSRKALVPRLGLILQEQAPVPDGLACPVGGIVNSK